MAEGFLRAMAGERFEVCSAGIRPSTVNPLAVEAMREAGVDISQQRSKDVADFLGQHFPYIITVCDNAKEHCPIFPGPAVRLHWPLEDPAAATGDHAARMVVFRRLRDQIREHVSRFCGEVS